MKIEGDSDTGSVVEHLAHGLGSNELTEVLLLPLGVAVIPFKAVRAAEGMRLSEGQAERGPHPADL